MEYLLILSIARHWAITLIECIKDHAKLHIDCSKLTEVECELLAQIPIWAKNYGQNTPTAYRHLWDCKFEDDNKKVVFHFFKDETLPCEHFECQFYENDWNQSLLACLFSNDSELNQQALIFWDKHRIIECKHNVCYAPAHIEGRHRVM